MEFFVHVIPIFILNIYDKVATSLSVIRIYNTAMRSVVNFTLKQTVFLNVVFIILVVAGLFSLYTIPIENMPTVDMGNVFIHTTYYGASAEDVETLVTKKIEDAIDGMESVEFIQSESYRNFSSVNVKFIDDTNYEDLYDDLRFRILNIKNDLPAGVDEPIFIYADTHIWMPVVVVNITGDMSQESLKYYADELKSTLNGIPGVRSVNIVGEYDREFHVSIDPEKLRKNGITFIEAARAIQSANTKIPTGRFRQDKTEFMLDAGKRLSTQEEVLNVIVRRDGDGNFIRIRDLVSSARLSHRDPNRIPTVNGENTIRLQIIKEDAGNSINISRAAKKASLDFQKLHEKDGIGIIFTKDSTIEINDSVKTLGGNLILGMTLVVVILWITLGFRNSMITAVGIPFSFICSIVIMRVTGVSVNTITLTAFVLVTGIIVDDAVIIMENVFRHNQMGKPKLKAVIDGTSEVMLPVISSVLTTILAFLPMLIMTGSTGDFFAQVPKTVTFALCASLLEALFLVPIHILDWGKEHKTTARPGEVDDPYIHLETGLFAPFWKIYRVFLKGMLNHKIITLGTVFIVFVAAVFILVVSITGIYPLINVKFFPGNYFRYHVTIEMPLGTSIEETDTIIRDLSKFIMSLGEKQAQSTSGTAGMYESIDYARHSGSHYGEIIVTLPEEKDRVFPENPENDPMKHLTYIRNKLNAHASEKWGGSGPVPKITVFQENDGPPTGKAVNIRVTGLTLDAALKATDEIMAFLKSNPEMKSLTDLSDDRPYYQKAVRYTPKLEKVYEYGLSPGDVTGLVAGTLNGYPAGQFRTIDEEVDLMVRLTRADDKANANKTGLADPLDIMNVPVIEHSASPILLKDLVNMEFSSEPHMKARYKGKPTVTISSDITEGAELSPARVQYLVAQFFKEKMDMFPGVSISYGGEFESTNKSYTSLTFAFFIALLGIYMVLSSQFNDYFQPIIIISAVPFALIGVTIGMFLTRTVFTVGSFLSVVGLAGVAVNNSLLLIDFMNVRRRLGVSLRDSVLEACGARMRPVVITTVTTILGLIPMAVGIPSKSISWSPMAMAFVTGLASSTLLTLLIVPVEYELVEGIKLFFQKKRLKDLTD